MVWEDLKPTDIATREAFNDAIVADMALGGSTNAIIHLTAMAGRADIKLTLDDFDAASKKTPMLVNLKPSGKYVMEDFYYSGGLRALLKQIGDLLNLDRTVCNGMTLGENIESAEIFNEDVIRPRSNPLSATGGTAALSGNLAPAGAIIKPTAAEPHLLKHTGPAVAFENVDDMYKRIDDPDLEVTKDSVLVLKNAGPKGAPGMPEWGQLPIPQKLLKQGVRDMVRISDCRMSGTSFGACVLHVAPEAAVGGNLALVKTGDLITLDVEARKLELHVSDEELNKRRATWTPPKSPYSRGYGALFMEHVTQADEGCDFDFLHAGPATPEPKIY